VSEGGQSGVHGACEFGWDRRRACPIFSDTAPSLAISVTRALAPSGNRRPARPAQDGRTAVAHAHHDAALAGLQIGQHWMLRVFDGVFARGDRIAVGIIGGLPEGLGDSFLEFFGDYNALIARPSSALSTLSPRWQAGYSSMSR